MIDDYHSFTCNLVVDMVPGRLLIFPSQYFHAAYHRQNSFYDFPRLTLAFWLVC